MNVDMFAQQIEDIHWRLSELYQGASALPLPPPDLLPVAFKELGIASEELQVAAEELHQQNEELETARASLEAERQRYQELFEEAPDGYLVINMNGTIQEANRAAAGLLNVEQRFLVGKPLFIFVSEEDRQSFHFQMARLQQEERVQEWIIRLSPRNSAVFDAALTVAHVRDRQGKPLALRVCVRDISERKQAEAGLERKDYDASGDRAKHVYLKGEIIHLKPQIIWQVCQGIVKLSTISENGEEVLVGLAGPEMVFGSDLTSLQTYQATALSDAQVVCYTLAEITASCDLAKTVFHNINQRLRQTEALLAISGMRHVEDRLYHLLQLLKKEFGQPVAQGIRISVRLIHQNLADACSTTRVTITRLLGKLQEQGVITFDSKNHIIVIDEGLYGVPKQKNNNFA